MSSILNFILLLLVGSSNLATLRKKSCVDSFHNQELHINTTSHITNDDFFWLLNKQWLLVLLLLLTFPLLQVKSEIHTVSKT